MVERVVEVGVVVGAVVVVVAVVALVLVVAVELELVVPVDELAAALEVAVGFVEPEVFEGKFLVLPVQEYLDTNLVVGFLDTNLRLACHLERLQQGIGVVADLDISRRLVVPIEAFVELADPIGVALVVPTVIAPVVPIVAVPAASIVAVLVVPTDVPMHYFPKLLV